MPAGRLPIAASVGAKTVNGPSPLKSSANSAAITAVSKIVWSGLPTIISTTEPGPEPSVKSSHHATAPTAPPPVSPVADGALES